jgi:thioredoxin 2
MTAGPTESGTGQVTLRCAFCLTLNQVDLNRAEQRPACGSCERPMLLDRPVKVTSEDFDRTVLGAGAPVLVDFYADWCAPCKILAPTMDEIARDNQGRLLVVKVDTDHSPDLAQRYGIRGVPTVILFRDGEEVERTWGIEPEKLAGMVEQAA